MKHLAPFSLLLGALCLATPATGWTKDKHHDHHDSHYCPPSVVYRSYRPYPYYGYAPYSYYSRPSIGLSFSTEPSYRYYRSSSSDYADDLAVDVQRALSRRGYYRGEIDGDVGPGTRSAIREYQYRNRLEVTGRIDRTLLRSLGLS
jgi:hypothetical protein